MASPTWFFDGDNRRIYEVPPSSSFVLVGGYRVYDGGTNAPVLTADVKSDLWSRWVDWMAAGNDWSLKAFTRSGGNLRPTGEYASADFQLRTDAGWRLVLANYPHETIITGNLFAVGSDSLFDNARLTADGIVPRLQGSANLLTYNTNSGGGYAGPTAADIWAHVLETGLSAEEVLRVLLATLAGRSTGVGTTTETYLSQNGATPRVTATFDTAGNRTAIVVNGS
jgi:hypothetical protein